MKFIKNLKLFIRFPDQSRSFSLGVEFGRIWEKIERGENIVGNNGFPIRIDNKELFIDVCEKYNYLPIFGKEYFGEWIEFIGIKKMFTKN